MKSGFDLDRFVGECLDAVRGNSPQVGVKEVVQRAVSRPEALEAVLTRKLGTNAGILHYSEELTVQHVVFPAGFRTGIHDHLVWAVIGTWCGHEDNVLYRPDGNGGVVEAGASRCEIGDVITLAEDAIHEVIAPPTTPSIALHVYGGALFDEPRREWVGRPPTERPIDDAAILTHYIEALTAAGLAC